MGQYQIRSNKTRVFEITDTP